MYCGKTEIIEIYPCLYNSLFNLSNIQSNHGIFGEMKNDFIKPYFQYCHCSIEEINYLRKSKSPNAFYAIILSQKRYFYLDIDFKILNQGYVIDIKNALRRSLINCISEEFKLSNKQIYGWDASRQKSNYYKISFHIVVPQIYLSLPNILKHVLSIKQKLSNTHTKFSDSIDMNVYHKIQAWRLPFCSNLDNASVFLPFNNNTNNLSIIKQIEINLLTHNTQNTVDLIKWHLNRQQNQKPKSILLRKLPAKQFIPDFIPDNIQFKHSHWIQYIVENPHPNMVKLFKVLNMKCLSTNDNVRSRSNAIVWKFTFLKWLDIACCSRCYKNYYFSLNNNLHYPWFYKFCYKKLSYAIIKDLDQVLHKLFTNNKIKNYSSSKYPYSIINTSTFKSLPNQNISHSFWLHKCIMCQICMQSNSLIHCQVRSLDHKYYKQYGRISIFCQNCKTYLS